MKYFLSFLIISSFYLQVQGVIGGACIGNEDCDAANREECANNFCKCRGAWSLGLDNTCKSSTSCAGDINACSPNGFCLVGMYCTCNEDYRGDGGTCESASPCNRTSPCHTDAVCIDGGNATDYNCICKPGFIGDGISCLTHEGAVDIVCDDTGMSITVLNSMYDNITFALQDKSCIFTNNGTHNTISIDYGTCGTTLTEENDYLIYSNRAETSKKPAIITRDPDHYIDLVCKLERSVNVTSDSLNVTNFDSINITKEKRDFTRRWRQKSDDTTTFALNLKLYPTEAFTTPYQNHQFPLQMNVRDYIYTETRLDTSNDNVKLIPQNCYATPTPSPSDATKHYVVQNRCVVDATYKEIGASPTALQIAFKAFQFLTTNDVYLHCELVVCELTSSAPECLFGCPSRKRREIEAREITEGKLEKYMLSSKRIILLQEQGNGDAKESLSSNNTMIFASLAIGLLIILAIIFAIVMIYRLKVANGRNNNADLDMEDVA